MHKMATLIRPRSFSSTGLSMRTLSSSCKTSYLESRGFHLSQSLCALLFVRSDPGYQVLPLVLAILEVPLVHSFPGFPDFRHDHHVHPVRVSLENKACHVYRVDMHNRRVITDWSNKRLTIQLQKKQLYVLSGYQYCAGL